MFGLYGHKKMYKSCSVGFWRWKPFSLGAPTPALRSQQYRVTWPRSLWRYPTWRFSCLKYTRQGIRHGGCAWRFSGTDALCVWLSVCVIMSVGCCEENLLLVKFGLPSVFAKYQTARRHRNSVYKLLRPVDPTDIKSVSILFDKFFLQPFLILVPYLSHRSNLIIWFETWCYCVWKNRRCCSKNGWELSEIMFYGRFLNEQDGWLDPSPHSCTETFHRIIWSFSQAWN